LLTPGTLYSSAFDASRKRILALPRVVFQVLRNKAVSSDFPSLAIVQEGD
jgi:hypothetical protein